MARDGIEGSHLTVIGAGPVGVVAALSVARRGHTVRVFEERPILARSRHGEGGQSTSRSRAEVGTRCARSRQRVRSARCRCHSRGGLSTFERLDDTPTPMVQTVRRCTPSGEIHSIRC